MEARGGVYIMKKCTKQIIDTIEIESLLKPDNEVNYIDSIRPIIITLLLLCNKYFLSM